MRYTLEQFRARLSAELERNGRLLELARHNGYAIELQHGIGANCTTALWRVPAELELIVGQCVLQVPA